MMHSDKLSKLEMWDDNASGGRVNIMQGVFDPIQCIIL
jgi:hypothetical protein